MGSFAVQNHRIAALALDSPDLRITIKVIVGLGHTHQVQRNQLTLKHKLPHDYDPQRPNPILPTICERKSGMSRVVFTLLSPDRIPTLFRTEPIIVVDDYFDEIFMRWRGISPTFH